jgi:hypothetical protein
LERFISAYEDLVAAKRRQPNRTNGSDAALLEDEKSSTERARDWASLRLFFGWEKWIKNGQNGSKPTISKIKPPKYGGLNDELWAKN